MTHLYFVRHAQPRPDWADESRPLTDEGKRDAEAVLAFFKDKQVDAFYCSPYRRSLDTIRETAAFFGQEIIVDERLRERERGGEGSNRKEMMRKRWADHDFHEPGGESIAMVQKRNMEAVRRILRECEGKRVVIGTHGTALSAIQNAFDPSFGCEDFLRIIDWMPYIVELTFDGDRLMDKTEHLHIEKEYRGKD